MISSLTAESKIEDNFSSSAIEKARLFRARHGERILYQGQSIEYLYYMISGRAKLCEIMPNGRQTLLDFLKAPCFIGEMELLGLREDTLLVQALEECLLLAFPFSSCRDILLNDPKFLRKMCFTIGQKERKKARALTQINAYPLVNRYAAFLLESASEGMCRDRQTDAAQYLGVTSRHLRQITSDFIQNGCLAREGRCLKIIAPDYLKMLADELKD